MPVKIESFEPLSEEEFTALRQQKTRKTDPTMVALLAEVETGRPVRVPLVEGQSARGLRTAISRAHRAAASPWKPSREKASSRCGRSMSYGPEKGSRHLRQRGGAGGAGHRIGRSNDEVTR